MNVENLMTLDVATCRPEDTLEHAARLMWEHDCGAIPVVDDGGRPIAMITDRDICMAAYTQGRALHALPVALAMSKSIVVCARGEPVATAESIMRSQQVRRLPIVDVDGRVAGILSLNDIATHAKKIRLPHDEMSAQAIATTLSAICARPRPSAAAE